MSDDRRDEFDAALDALIASFHAGSYESGFEIADLLRKKPEQIEEEIADDMSVPSD